AGVSSRLRRTSATKDRSRLSASALHSNGARRRLSLRAGRQLHVNGRRVTLWVVWLAAVVVATAGMHAIRGSLDKAHVTLVFLILVLGASAAGGRALGLTVAALGFVAFDLYFLPPYNTLTITNPLDWLVLVVFLVT